MGGWGVQARGGVPRSRAGSHGCPNWALRPSHSLAPLPPFPTPLLPQDEEQPAQQFGQVRRVVVAQVGGAMGEGMRAWANLLCVRGGGEGGGAHASEVWGPCMHLTLPPRARAQVRNHAQQVGGAQGWGKVAAGVGTVGAVGAVVVEVAARQGGRALLRAGSSAGRGRGLGEGEKTALVFPTKPGMPPLPRRPARDLGAAPPNGIPLLRAAPPHPRCAMHVLSIITNLYSGSLCKLRPSPCYLVPSLPVPP